VSARQWAGLAGMTCLLGGFALVLDPPHLMTIAGMYLAGIGLMIILRLEVRYRAPEGTGHE
jgi:hypothetical protein